MQSRRASLIEAATNVLTGLVQAFLMQLALFNALGIITTLQQNLAITAAFSGLSIIRSYLLRRLFDFWSSRYTGDELESPRLG